MSAERVPGFVDAAILERVRIGREYVAAKYGFRNHWYPALFSAEIAEEQVVPVQLLGERILLKRVDGRVYGIRDRCLHRGVQLSRKIECFTQEHDHLLVSRLHLSRRRRDACATSSARRRAA